MGSVAAVVSVMSRAAALSVGVSTNISPLVVIYGWGGRLLREVCVDRGRGIAGASRVRISPMIPFEEHTKQAGHVSGTGYG